MSAKGAVVDVIAAVGGLAVCRAFSLSALLEGNFVADTGRWWCRCPSPHRPDCLRSCVLRVGAAECRAALFN